MNTIYLIRAEIERRIHETSHPLKDGYEIQSIGKIEGLSELLDFLDTLESETPMNQEELEDEMDRFFETMPVLEHENIFEDTFKNIARHFAQWGADHTPLPEDTVLFNKGVEEGKRLMMEEAVEAKIYGYGDGSFELIASWLDMPNNSIYKDGDKVRIIVIPKED